MKISTGISVQSNKLKTVKISSFLDLKEILKPKYSRVTLEKYREMSKEEQTQVKKKVPFWSGSIFEDNLRKKTKLLERHLFTGDLDFAPSDWEQVLKDKLKGIPYIAHTTISHDPQEGKHKIRLIIPLSQPITDEDTYKTLCHNLMTLVGEEYFDSPTTCDVARAMFNPIKLTNQDFKFKLCNKSCEPYDVSELQEISVDDDDNLIELEDGTKENLKLENYVDPRTRPGIEGLFCTVYTCREIMEKYSPDDYEESNQDRWSYTKGSTRDGIIFYEDDILLQSRHESDPLNLFKKLGRDKQWNAFELFTKFYCDDDIDKAEKIASKDPLVRELLQAEFENFESDFNKCKDVAEDNDGQLLPLDWTEFLQLENPNDVVKYLMPRMGKAMVGNKCYLVYITKGDDKLCFDSIKEMKELTSRFKQIKVNGKNKNVWDYWSEHMSQMFIFNRMVFEPQAYVSGLYQEEMNDDPFRPKVKNIPSHTLNTFSGYPIKARFDDEYEKPKLFIDYVMNVLCNGEKGKFDWVMDWIADIFQNPGRKPGTALVLYSPEKGTGKSTLVELILKSMLDNMCTLVDGSRLNSQFNSFMERKLVIGIDDLEFQGKRNAGVLRSKITQQEITIERKGTESYIMNDFCRWVLTSNHSHAAEIDFNHGERRYTILRLNSARKTDQQYWQELKKDFNDEKVLQDTLQYLLTRKIKNNLTYAYETEEYDEFASQSADPLTSYLFDLQSEGYQKFITPFMNGDGWEIEGDGIIKIDDDKIVWISKAWLREEVNSNYSKRFKQTTHQFTKMIKESKLITDSNIVIGEEARGEIRSSGNNRARCLGFPLSFFDGSEEYDDEINI